MSLQDVIDPPPPPPPPPSSTPLPSSRPTDDHNSDPLIDEISIPNISAQIFDFCDTDLFTDTLQNSEVTSSPNCYCYEDQNSSYASAIVDEDTKNKFSTENLDIHSLQNDQNATNASTSGSTTTTANTLVQDHHNYHSSGLSIIFDPHVEIDNDISASIDFSPSPPFSNTPPYNLNPTNNKNHPNTQQDQYHHHLSTLSDVAISNGLNQYPTTMDPVALPLMAMVPPPLGPVFEDDCLSSIPPFLRLNPSTAATTTSFLDPSMTSFLHGNLNPGLGADNPGIFTGSLLMASDLQPKELDFQADNSGIFCPDQLPRYNSGDLQAFSNENSQLVSAATSSAPMTTEIANLEESTFKVGKLSVEQRKEKIHRYMKKRNERNFSKKIKYACRKTLADSRPRVRGRFAKNDDFGENNRHINNHEDDEYDDVMVKEEDEVVDSSDIFAHISGVNSFKCNYQHIQSWI